MKKKFKNYINQMRSSLNHPRGHELLDELEVIVDQSDELNLNNGEKKKTINSDLRVPEEAKGSGARFVLFTDGACRGNPGPGAWGALIQKVDSTIVWEAKEFEEQTTNNKMELLAVIMGLRECVRLYRDNCLSFKTPLFLYSDSKYVLEGIRSWMSGWKARGWKKADKKAPENLSLWQELDQLVENFDKLELKWVKGHSGHPQNDYVDALANAALDSAGF